MDECNDSSMSHVDGLPIDIPEYVPPPFHDEAM